MWTDLFLYPLLTGLLLSILLPLLGCYLRLRGEWLAALAYAHIAAAGALGALVLGALPILGGLCAAVVAGMSKSLGPARTQQTASFPLLLLAGWSLSILLAANHPLAERMGHALFDGQLYFADGFLLAGVAGGCLGALLLLQHFSAHLRLQQLFPDFFRIRNLPAWPTRMGFDILTALCLALATLSMGVMGAFTLVFIPPWLAFQYATSWRSGLWLALGLGVSGYLLAFFLALYLDQPFGPVLALLLLLLGLAGMAWRR